MVHSSWKALLAVCDGSAIQWVSNYLNISQFSDFLHTNFKYACRTGNEPLVARLLSYGATPYYIAYYIADEIGYHYLHYVAESTDRGGIAKLLVANGASPLSTTDQRHTPLVLACAAGNVDMVMTLLKLDKKTDSFGNSYDAQSACLGDLGWAIFHREKGTLRRILLQIVERYKLNSARTLGRMDHPILGFLADKRKPETPVPGSHEWTYSSLVTITAVVSAVLEASRSRYIDFLLLKRFCKDRFSISEFSRAWFGAEVLEVIEEVRVLHDCHPPKFPLFNGNSDDED